jgi:hypothetical protein
MGDDDQSSDESTSFISSHDRSLFLSQEIQDMINRKIAEEVARATARYRKELERNLPQGDVQQDDRSVNLIISSPSAAKEGSPISSQNTSLFSTPGSINSPSLSLTSNDSPISTCSSQETSQETGVAAKVVKANNTLRKIKHSISKWENKTLAMVFPVLNDVARLHFAVDSLEADFISDLRFVQFDCLIVSSLLLSINSIIIIVIVIVIFVV